MAMSSARYDSRSKQVRPGVPSANGAQGTQATGWTQAPGNKFLPPAGFRGPPGSAQYHGAPQQGHGAPQQGWLHGAKQQSTATQQREPTAHAPYKGMPLSQPSSRTQQREPPQAPSLYSATAKQAPATQQREAPRAPSLYSGVPPSQQAAGRGPPSNEMLRRGVDGAPGPPVAPGSGAGPLLAPGAGVQSAATRIPGATSQQTSGQQPTSPMRLRQPDLFLSPLVNLGVYQHLVAVELGGGEDGMA